MKRLSRAMSGHVLLSTTLLAVPLLAGCAQSGPTSVTVELPSTTASTDYVIGPGDVLSINVYHVPELSISLPVRPDGRFSMPLINDLDAAGKTPTQLAQDVQARLRDYVKEATVSIIVTTFQSTYDRQVRVIGEAAQPMAFPYRDRMTLLDVMIEAKGLTRFAAGNSAQIMRRNGNKLYAIPVRLSDLIRDGDMTKNIPIQPGDTLVIPQTWF